MTLRELHPNLQLQRLEHRSPNSADNEYAGSLAQPPVSLTQIILLRPCRILSLTVSPSINIGPLLFEGHFDEHDRDDFHEEPVNGDVEGPAED